ncbi:DUF2239 family protein [Pigmentiphaga aceris]|uniref:DUF2239 family protein n=1 Tax=Pigmentiphaga aceris TaxID=1940612 RepID=A0A5C0ARK5_9BURK|nr:DUF2239 family protein [Pigmentiphaga aceris]QEI04728.1 DUF2239 family protein [Pigmentiphaga aceris]
MTTLPTHSAFADDRRIAHGSLSDVALHVGAALTSGETGILIFDNTTGEQIDLDLRGSPDDIVARLALSHPQPAPVPEAPAPAPAAPRGPGRPKLGVVAREITLLPRHWAWLAEQPGGASVTLRKLVDAARQTNAARDAIRQAQDAACHFMTTMAGNRPRFEDALRALYASDATGFDTLTEDWPSDVRQHARWLAEPALSKPVTESPAA